MSSIRNKILLVLVGLFWLGVIAVITIWILLSTVFNYDREAVFAGYAAGSIVDYNLELYPDSTYYISCFLNPDKKPLTWTKSGDTIYLKIGNESCATFKEESLIDFSCQEIRCLELMQFRAFEQPKIVEYPNNR
ncbi:MAG: hypothetical protein AAFY36_19110 [Bacteroidota bacterium]